jgi:hypothetical protein
MLLNILFITMVQERSDEGGRLMHPAKKRTKIVAKAISSFFGSKTPHKRHDEVQKLFLEDLVLPTTKGYLLLSTCENVWMHRLALRLDSKLVFPTQRALEEEILLAMVDRYLNLYVRLLFATIPITMATFNLWMNMTPLFFVIIFLSPDWKPWHVIVGLFEANDITRG